jgi:hypothetical protein
MTKRIRVAPGPNRDALNTFHHLADQAACAGRTDVHDYIDKDLRALHTGLELCGSCPVRPECLAVALHYDTQGYGVWGLWAGMWWGQVPVNNGAYARIRASRRLPTQRRNYEKWEPANG